ncbi:MAG: hypothetical protein DYG99_04995 [Bacteroidetes bacterium CHB5]|nr:hypothetical protein [Bacteroidetes bacterium CHB5]
MPEAARTVRANSNLTISGGVSGRISNIQPKVAAVNNQNKIVGRFISGKIQQAATRSPFKFIIFAFSLHV